MLLNKLIAGDQVVLRMAFQNNVLYQWATLKDSQNTFRHTYVVQIGKKADGSLSMGTVPRADAILFIVQCHRLSHSKMFFLSDQWSAR